MDTNCSAAYETVWRKAAIFELKEVIPCYRVQKTSHLSARTMPPNHRKHCFDDECELALEAKNEANAKWIQTNTRATTRESYKLFSDERKRVYRLLCGRPREHEEVKDIHGYRK